jgi:hypothetical protein
MLSIKLRTKSRIHILQNAFFNDLKYFLHCYNNNYCRNLHYRYCIIAYGRIIILEAYLMVKRAGHVHILM